MIFTSCAVTVRVDLVLIWLSCIVGSVSDGFFSSGFEQSGAIFMHGQLRRKHQFAVFRNIIEVTIGNTVIAPQALKLSSAASQFN